MTIQETSAVLDVLAAAYPAFYKNFTADEKYKAAVLWAEMFIIDPAELVAAAVKFLIAVDSKGFPPTIGQVREKMLLMTRGGGMTEQEAWRLVRRACKYYDARDEFEKLPLMLRRLIGSPSQLREWALLDEDALGTVVASNFMRSFRARQKSESELAMLPPSVRKMLTDTEEEA